MEINEEGRRLLANLAQHYDAWRVASRHLAPGRLAWKRVSGRGYLYRIVDRQGIAALDLVAAHMPHLPMDEAFEAELPDELRGHWQRWKSAR